MMTDEELRIISKEIFGEPLSFIDMDLNKFIKETNKPDVLRRYGINPTLESWLRPRIVCEDGVILSVQASEIHYCCPRKSKQESYTHYEVMLIGDHDLDEFVKSCKKKYQECVQWFIDNDGDGVYAEVPHDILQGYIDAHGGIKDFGRSRKK